jgi:hypothetical protein
MLQSFTYVCLLVSLNIITALLFFDESQWVKQFFAIALRNRVAFILILFTLPVIIISYWIPGGRYKQILKDFDDFAENGSDRQKVLVSTANWVYQIGTWALFFISIF